MSGIRHPNDHFLMDIVKKPFNAGTSTIDQKKDAITAAQKVRNSGITTAVHSTLFVTHAISIKDLTDIITSYAVDDPDETIENLQKEINDLERQAAAALLHQNKREPGPYWKK